MATTKFMTNILIEPKHRTRYVRQLASFTKDAQISYQRIIVALLGATVIGVTYFYLAQHIPMGNVFVLTGFFVSLTSLFVVVVLYMLPSRGRSMLQSVFDLGAYYIGERARRRNPVISYGVENIEADGTICFENGYFGVLYRTEGHMGRSVLPQVIDRASDAKRRYLVAQSASTSVTLFTELRRFDASSQVAEHRTMGLLDTQPFNRHLNDVQAGFLLDNIHERSTVISQLTLVSDSSRSNLLRACREFETAAGEGLLSFFERCNNRRMVVDNLAGVCHFKRAVGEGVSVVGGS